MSPAVLPIDEHLPALVKALREQGRAVLVAEPGAGKTTRVPVAMAQAYDGAIWVLQPRRLAAAVAARRVAAEQGWNLGEQVGYHFRFDRRESDNTRILYLTEGMFLRRLQGNPNLDGVSAVVLDEFHERSLDADLGFALLNRLRQRGAKQALLVMSATLDSDAVATALDSAPVLNCPGRRFDVDIRYLDSGRSDADERLEQRLRRGLKQDAGSEGHILVFLPGQGEIRRAAALLAKDPAFESFRILPLHGGLSPAEQEAALAPSERRKILLSTNVAETSLTVPGVRLVVDSGFTRKERFHPWNGLSSLVTLPASQASMRQRAGRAGREAPGQCLRLCSSAEFSARAAYDPPEIALADLAPAMLQVKAAGFDEEPSWLDAPPEKSETAAWELLENLGAIKDGRLTDQGRWMASMSLHPRLAAVLCYALPQNQNQEDELARCVSFLSEERAQRLDFWKELDQWQPRGNAARLAERCRKWMRRGKAGDSQWRERLAKALLAAFPAQVARAAKDSDKRGELKFALASGGQAVAVDEANRWKAGLYLLLSVVELKDHRGQSRLPKVTSMIELDDSWLMELFEDRLKDEVQVSWDDERKRVRVASVLKYMEMVVDEGGEPAQAGEEAAKLLVDQARKAGLEKFFGEGQPQRYLLRRDFAMKNDPSLALPDEAEVERLFVEVAASCRSFEDLSAADPMSQIMARVDPAARRRLEELAPKKLKMPSGRETSIHYEKGKDPWVQGYMQDFFGLNKTPKGLVVHLLGPNKRPVQVTGDLPGFWVNHYPTLRKELSRKYPKHYWPEDPSQADPKLLKRHRGK